MKELFFSSKWIFFLIMMVCLATSLFAQNNYYWENGKKVAITEDNSSLIIYEKENSGFTIQKTPQMREIKKGNSKRLGNYDIVRFADSKSVNTFVGDLNKDLIKNVSHRLTTVKGDSLFLTPFIILKLKDGKKLDNFKELLEKFDLKHYSTKYKVIYLETDHLENILEAANAIYEHGGVEWCRPNFIRNMDIQPTALWEKQYYLHNVQHYCNAFNNDINALEAWQISLGSPAIRVAVLDDGVEDHPDLTDAYGNSRVLLGYSVPGFPPYGRPHQSVGKHGQACTGIIAASHSDIIRGVAPNVMIIPVNLGLDESLMDELEVYDAMN